MRRITSSKSVLSLVKPAFPGSEASSSVTCREARKNTSARVVNDSRSCTIRGANESCERLRLLRSVCTRSRPRQTTRSRLLPRDRPNKSCTISETFSLLAAFIQPDTATADESHWARGSGIDPYKMPLCRRCHRLEVQGRGKGTHPYTYPTTWKIKKLACRSKQQMNHLLKLLLVSSKFRLKVLHRTYTSEN